MLDRMPMPQLLEWVAYAQIEPFGEERADLRAGIVASTIANVHRRPGKPAYRATDFMPKFRRRAQTVEEMGAIFMTAAMAAKAARG